MTNPDEPAATPRDRITLGAALLIAGVLAMLLGFVAVALISAMYGVMPGNEDL